MKRFILTLSFLFVIVLTFAADRYIRNAGGNYNAAGTWELTPGGGESVAVPTASDDVKCTATSGNLTITAAGAVCKTIDLSSYTDTITINSGYTLTVSGNITLPGGVNGAYAGTGTLAIAATNTLTSNGITISGNLSFTVATTTTTLVGNVVVNGLLTIVSTTINKTTTETITSAGGLMLANASGAGTAEVILTGGSVFSFNTGSHMRHNLTISGNVTIGTATYNQFCYNTGTFTYSSGTVSYYDANTTVYCSANTTWNTGSGMAAIPKLLIGATAVLTLNADLYISMLYLQGGITSFSGIGSLTTSGTAWEIDYLRASSSSSTILTLPADLTINEELYIIASSSYITFNGFTIYLKKNLTLAVSTVATGLIGTTNLQYIGTGTWTGSGPILSGCFYIGLNLTINTAGTLTLGQNVAFAANTLTYTSGTIDATTNNSTLWLLNTPILNTNGLQWNRIGFLSTATSGMTVTLASNLQATTLNFFNFKTTFSGNYDVTCTNWMMFPTNNSNVEAVLVAGRTYTVTGKLELYGTANYAAKITSSAASNANFIHTGGRQQNIMYAVATWIDSSGGNKIWYKDGTMSNTTNWNQLVDGNMAPLTTGGF
jgi:hypothetical protein